VPCSSTLLLHLADRKSGGRKQVTGIAVLQLITGFTNVINTQGNGGRLQPSHDDNIAISSAWEIRSRPTVTKETQVDLLIVGSLTRKIDVHKLSLSSDKTKNVKLLMECFEAVVC
jgi:hypothetical protein